ncbi:MAG: SurA N-terminal domain-containing protein [Bacteroidia bacterium]
MAVIGKIRQRAGLLVGVVFVSLVLFVLGDLLTSNSRFLRGSETTVAEIGGKKVKIQDFQERVAKMEENYKTNSNKENIDQATADQLRDQAWGQLLNEQLLGKQYEKVGIKVSPEEIFDMVQGKNPHQQIKDAFKDPKTGQFNPANVIQFLKNMDNDQSGKTRAQWLAFESFLKEDRTSQKFNNLIKQGLFVTTEEAKRDYDAKGKQATIKYVKLDYGTIPDSSIKPSESDLKDYYNNNQNKFKQEASRKVEYVTFEVNPSEADRKESSDYIVKLEESFKTSTDDSAFVKENSDSRLDSAFHKKGTLSPMLDTVFFNAPVGTVIGPYEENGYFRISKLIVSKDIPDSIKVSHALIAYKGAQRAPESVTLTKEEAKSRADSLFKLAEKDPANFIDIAKNKSDDIVSATKEGDLGWMNMESGMDARFKAGAFETDKGKVKLVESDFGFHIIKVFDISKTSSKQVKVATVDRRIEAGTKTYQTSFAKATEFAGKNNTAEAFDKACKDQGLNKRVAESLSESEKNVPGLDNAREMVRWAFRSEKGQVTEKPYEFGNKFVVAKLVEIKEKGIAPLEQVKDQITTEVIKDLKSKKLIEKMNAGMSGATNIDALASKLGQAAETVSNVNFGASYVQAKDIGMEPALVGTVFTLKQGQLSKPIKGESGVYAVQVESFTEPPAMKDFTQNKNQLIQQLGGRASYEVFNALKEKANVVDNRGKFY